MRSWLAILIVAAALAEAFAGPGEDAAAAWKLHKYTEALALARPAAAKGDAKAAFVLGQLYGSGKGGVESDYAAAAKWYKAAAEKGDPIAQVWFASSLAGGRGVPKDQAEADRWYVKAVAGFRAAAEKGDAESALQLGYLYANGSGVNQDYAKALKLFRSAAEHGSPEAMSRLRNNYKYGKEGVAKDEAEGAAWDRRAFEAYKDLAGKGDLDATYAVAEAYDGGNGVAEDQDQAFTWYRKASEAGHEGAMYSLGLRYRYGVGTAEDWGQAAAWMKKANALGNHVELYIAKLYEEGGPGLEKDGAEAAKWYQKSADDLRRATAFKAK